MKTITLEIWRESKAPVLVNLSIIATASLILYLGWSVIEFDRTSIMAWLIVCIGIATFFGWPLFVLSFHVYLAFTTVPIWHLDEAFNSRLYCGVAKRHQEECRVRYAKEAQYNKQFEDYKRDPWNSPLSSPKVNIPLPPHQFQSHDSLQSLCRSCMALFPDIKEPSVAIDSLHGCLANCNGSIVTFNRRYLDTQPKPGELVYIMKHELIHAWIIQNKYPDNGDDGHGDLFQAKAREIGIKG
jgi:hypothetical protein